MISLDDYYMGRDRQYPDELSDGLRENAQDTVKKVNELLALFKETRIVTSGWRPAAVNASTPNAASKSKHMTCQACDLDDPEGDLDQWALENRWALENIGLWMEHPAATKGWAHFQTVPPKSGKRIFYP